MTINQLYALIRSQQAENRKQQERNTLKQSRCGRQRRHMGDALSAAVTNDWHKRSYEPTGGTKKKWAKHSTHEGWGK
jgi:hypothetical protein